METSVRAQWQYFSKSKPTPPIDVRVEPRIAPQPISSGLSMRMLPAPSMVAIVQACQHYERKCAGQYSAKTTAARYLYDLSREVQDLARGMDTEEKALRARIAQLEDLVKDWTAVFGEPHAPTPDGLQRTRAGLSKLRVLNQTPTKVAEIILQQQAELLRQREALSAQETDHARELSSLRRALHEQQAAAATQYTSEMDRQKRQREQAVAAVRSEAQRSVSSAQAGLRERLAEAREQLQQERASLLSRARQEVHAELKQANDARFAAEERAEEAEHARQRAICSHQAEVHTLRAELRGAQEALQTVLEREAASAASSRRHSLLGRPSPATPPTVRRRGNRTAAQSPGTTLGLASSEDEKSATAALRCENEELRARVGRLEGRIEELLEVVEHQRTVRHDAVASAMLHQPGIAGSTAPAYGVLGAGGTGSGAASVTFVPSGEIVAVMTPGCGWGNAGDATEQGLPESAGGTLPAKHANRSTVYVRNNARDLWLARHAQPNGSGAQATVDAARDAWV